MVRPIHEAPPDARKKPGGTTFSCRSPFRAQIDPLAGGAWCERVLPTRFTTPSSPATSIGYVTNSTEIQIPIGEGAFISASADLPSQPRGLVLFAHGSGSSRMSPRNRYVAQVLRDARFGTFLMDLLTEREDVLDQRTAEFRFDIDLLAERLGMATRWVRRQAGLESVPLGYFGASTGAAAALVAAARLPEIVAAVVSRGGRPDLAGAHLKAVRAPTLLIVGGADTQVIELNRLAMESLQSEHELVIVPNATHLFEEPGALEEVARLARDWFVQYTGPSATGR
jgi:dienelactone hydrolase